MWLFETTYFTFKKVDKVSATIKNVEPKKLENPMIYQLEFCKELVTYLLISSGCLTHVLKTSWKRRLSSGCLRPVLKMETFLRMFNACLENENPPGILKIA